MAAASQTKPQTEDLYLKKIHKINAMLHQLLKAGGLAKGPCQQGVLHPDGAVRVGGVSPLLARAVTVLFSWELPRKYSSSIADAALAIVLEGISCELTGM